MTDHARKNPLAAIVREAWQGADTMPDAAEALYSAIAGDGARYQEIAPQVLRAWCRDQISAHVGAIRLAAIDWQQEPTGNRLRQVIAVTLFDFPLPGGKRLGDANAVEIREGAKAYGDTADDAALKARWLGMVAVRVGRKNKAENALTLDQLQTLYVEAEHA